MTEEDITAEQSEDASEVQSESKKRSQKPRKPKNYGLMFKTLWGGKPMFKCPHCGASTFDQSEAEKHNCLDKA